MSLRNQVKKKNLLQRFNFWLVPFICVIEKRNKNKRRAGNKKACSEKVPLKRFLSVQRDEESRPAQERTKGDMNLQKRTSSLLNVQGSGQKLIIKDIKIKGTTVLRNAFLLEKSKEKP